MNTRLRGLRAASNATAGVAVLAAVGAVVVGAGAYAVTTAALNRPVDAGLSGNQVANGGQVQGQGLADGTSGVVQGQSGDDADEGQSDDSGGVNQNPQGSANNVQPNNVQPNNVGPGGFGPGNGGGNGGNSHAS